jgi:hypothetical protein
MKTVLRFFVLGFIALLNKANAQQQVSFSVQAHQDDWQLFWVQTMMNEFNSGNKVVFITLTAGDGGNSTGAYCSPVPFFLARERAAINSTKYGIDLGGGISANRPDSVKAIINGHTIVKYTYKNSVNYFLRLADGGIGGGGNPFTGNVSLKKFKWGQIPSMNSIDGTATYNGWQDVVATLKSIINTEKGTDNQVTLHTSSLDTTRANSNDHSDHIYSSLAAQEAVADMLWVGINEYIGYDSPSYPQNLTTAQLAAATAIFATNSWGLLESKYAAPFDPGHKGWLPMDVLVVKRLPVGNAPGTTTPSSGLRQNGEVTGLRQVGPGVILYDDYKKQLTSTKN